MDVIHCDFSVFDSQAPQKDQWNKNKTNQGNQRERNPTQLTN